jgi:hypothetical protein
MEEVEVQSDVERGVQWLAVYSDGNVLPQFNQDGSQNAYGDIERSKLSEFHLMDPLTGDVFFSMALEPGQRLIYRRRVSMDGQSGLVNWVVYLVGWQETVGGKNVQSLNWIFPNGQIINTGRFREDHPIFYSVELVGPENDEIQAMKEDGIEIPEFGK